MSVGLCPPAHGGAGGDDGRWFGILYPEEAGSSGLGLVDMTVLMDMAADMLVDIENAKSLTYYAAWAIDEGLAEGPLAAGPTGRMPTAKWPAPASNYTAASALPRSTTCSSISSAPRPPRSPSATPLGTASASLG
jgi:hypothetical protein